MDKELQDISGEASIQPSGEQLPTPPTTCQVCGDILSDPVVWCRKCHTPHHKDCWYYNRWCSTYGCRSRFSLSVRPAGSDLDAPIKIDIDTVADNHLSKSHVPQLHTSDLIKFVDFFLIPARLVCALLWAIAEGFVMIPNPFCMTTRDGDEVTEQDVFFTTVKISMNGISTYIMYIAGWIFFFPVLFGVFLALRAVPWFLAYVLFAFVFSGFKRYAIKKKLEEKNRFAQATRHKNHL